MAKVFRKPGVRVLLAAAAAVSLAAGITGCYDQSTNVTLADPGHYKGGTDPLVQKLQTGSKLSNQLRERVTLVQAAE